MKLISRIMIVCAVIVLLTSCQFVSNGDNQQPVGDVSYAVSTPTSHTASTLYIKNIPAMIAIIVEDRRDLYVTITGESRVVTARNQLQIIFCTLMALQANVTVIFRLLALLL